MFHRRWNGLNLDRFRITNSDRATQKGRELLSHRQSGSVIVYFENDHTSLAIERNGAAHRDLPILSPWGFPGRSGIRLKPSKTAAIQLTAMLKAAKRSFSAVVQLRPQQPFVIAVHRLVAFARAIQQTRGVENLNFTTGILDEAGFL